MASATHRKKLSTTISSESYAYIERQISNGQASSAAEVVDRALERMRRFENRSRLEHDTAAYFNGLTSGAAREEAELGVALGRMSEEVDLDA